MKPFLYSFRLSVGPLEIGRSNSIKVRLLRVSFCLLLITNFCGDTSSAKNKPCSVLVYGGEGKLLKASHYIWLTQSRIGIPFDVYESLGLGVGYAGNKRQVIISEPDTDASIVFSVDAHRFFYPAGGEYSDYYDHPLSKRWRRDVYVAAFIVQENFKYWFKSKWDQQTGTLYLHKLQNVPTKEPLGKV